MPTLHVLFDPVIGAQMVKPITRFCIAGMCRWETRFLNLLLQNRIDRFKASPHFLRIVISIEEIHDGLRLIWYCSPQVDSFEFKALDQAQECVVIIINKFTAQFTHHAIRPDGGIRMHAPANMV